MKEEELINKWLLDKLSKDEETSFKRSAEYHRIIKIWEGLPEVATPPFFDIERELEQFKKNHRSNKKTVIKVFWNQRLIGIAASLAFIFVLGYLLFQPKDKSGETVFAESHKQLFLPDSSMVILNKNSRLSYGDEDWLLKRNVQLEGEAYFEVKEGSVFNVVSSHGMVTVLGTSFNVKQRDQFYEVICFTGKVEVKTDNYDEKLGAGEGFHQIDGNLTRFSVEKKDGVAWLSGKSTFYKTPYQTVLSEIENQYDISIEIEEVNLMDTFTGSFPNNDLNTALDAITIPSNYHYKMINKDKVLIYREGS